MRKKLQGVYRNCEWEIIDNWGSFEISIKLPEYSFCSYLNWPLYPLMEECKAKCEKLIDALIDHQEERD